MDPLAVPDDLVDFPGSFTLSQIDSASDEIRSVCNWHIAPTLTETLTVESDGGLRLFLPTLQLLAVTEVRSIADDGTTTVLTGWRDAATTQFRAGILFRSLGWPAGIIEADVQHGYATAPKSLLPVIAERCQRYGKDSTVRQESLGSRSASFGLLDDSSAHTLARYKLGGRP